MPSEHAMLISTASRIALTPWRTWSISRRSRPSLTYALLVPKRTSEGQLKGRTEDHRVETAAKRRPEAGACRTGERGPVERPRALGDRAGQRPGGLHLPIGLVVALG